MYFHAKDTELYEELAQSLLSATYSTLICLLCRYYDIIQSLPKLDQGDMNIYLIGASQTSDVPNATYARIEKVENVMVRTKCYQSVIGQQHAY